MSEDPSKYSIIVMSGKKVKRIIEKPKEPISNIVNTGIYRFTSCLIMDNTYEVLLSNIKEIKARGSPVVAVADEKDEEVEKYVDYVIRAPSVDPIFTLVTYSVALQPLAYYTARKRGCDR